MLPTIITLNGWVETQKERTKQVLKRELLCESLETAGGWSDRPLKFPRRKKGKRDHADFDLIGEER